MANAVENDEFEDADMPAEEEDEADARRHKRRRRRPNKVRSIEKLIRERVSRIDESGINSILQGRGASLKVGGERLY